MPTPTARAQLAIVAVAALSASCGRDTSAFGTQLTVPIASPVQLAKTQPDQSVTFRFDWPRPGKVTIDEFRWERRRSAKLRYGIVIENGDAATIVRQTDVEYVQVNDIDATDARVRDQMAPLEALGTMMPITIDTEGRSLGPSEPDEFFAGQIATLKTVLEKVPKGAGPSIEQLEKVLRSPMGRTLTIHKGTRHWDLWIGMFAGAELRPGESFTDVVSDTRLGFEIPTEIEVENRGFVEQPEGHVHVVATSRIPGKALGAALPALLGPVLEEFQTKGAPLTEVAAALTGGVVTATVDAIVDPDTLRPSRVFFVRRVKMTYDGESRNEDIERTLWRFRW